jgi:hypothetical protein
MLRRQWRRPTECPYGVACAAQVAGGSIIAPGAEPAFWSQTTDLGDGVLT